VRLLFVKDELAWPRTSGHDVHTYYMMRGLQDLGHEISLLTRRPPAPEAVAGLAFGWQSTFDAAAGTVPCEFAPQLSPMQERFRSYWGVERAQIGAVASACRTSGAQVLVAVGLDSLPWLAAAPGLCRVWYAADEWFLHHLSLVRALEPKTWPSLKQGAIKLLYERAFAPLVDRTWVVSDGDRRTMQWLAGMRQVDVIPNGVDGTHFTRPDESVTPNTCVFWGRLDFEPNIQGLEWFCRNVWPRVRAAVPAAELKVFGFNPVPAALALGELPGVSVTPNLPDLRREVVRQAVAVLPFVTGGGIKNKILEAAALAMPIVCTKRACGGLRDANPPFIATDDPATWASEIASLWQNEPRRRELGRSARDWVLAHHTWEVAAREAAAGLAASLAARLATDRAPS
jgi:glycosyltransferase involved in cell wall biosynthesis